MSRENVETVRRALEAFNQGDVDRALDFYDPWVEVKTLLSGSAHGHDEVRAAIAGRERDMGAVQYLPEEFIDAGDTIVGVLRVKGTGRRTEISDEDFPSGQRLGIVWTLRGGLVIRQEMFSSKADALAAVGLSE